MASKGEAVTCIVIVGVVVGVLTPVFQQAREVARSSSCYSSAHELGAGLMQYAQDYDGKLPTKSWQEALESRRHAKVRCPAVPKGKVGYALQSRLSGKNPNLLARPEETPLLWESLNLSRNASDSGLSFTVRHGRGGVIALADGHVKRQSEREGQALIFRSLVWEKRP